MKTFWEGLLTKNPVFILALGLVPAIAGASTAVQGLVLGMIGALALVVAALLDYLFEPKAPAKTGPVLKTLVLIVLVVVVYSLLLSWQPQLASQLVIVVPLLVVSSILLQPKSRAEGLNEAMLRSVSEGLGFVFALVVIGVVREFLGFGSIFGSQLVKGSLPPLALAATVPGGMIIVGILMGIFNKVTKQGEEAHD